MAQGTVAEIRVSEIVASHVHGHLTRPLGFMEDLEEMVGSSRTSGNSPGGSGKGISNKGNK